VNRESSSTMKIRSLRLAAVFSLLAASLIVFALPVQANGNGFDTTVCEGTIPGEEISKACLDLMESFPSPTVVEIPTDRQTLSNYSFWKVVGEQPLVFDAPHGNVLRDMGQGFNFVRVINNSDGWIQIGSGEWMRESDLEFRPASRYKGVQILNGLQNEFAWVLGNLFTSTYPGGPQDVEEGRLLLRYDRVNVFAEAHDENGWRWYMVGPDQWIEQRMVAKAFRIDRPEGVSGRWVAVDLYEQTLVAYEDDTPVFATIVGTGLPGWDTREGLFKVWAALDRDRMSGFAGAPSAYDLQSVPWVMYFDDAIALHGTYWHDGFGYRRSRGCVNLSISDARFIRYWFQEAEPNEDGEVENWVYVHSSGEYLTTGPATK
jgi:hypothetical protein